MTYNPIPTFAMVVGVTLVAASAFAQNVPQPKMGAPLAGLSANELAQFDAGRVDFTHVFQAAEGLGPIFNQNACSTCHNNPIGGSGGITVTRFGLWDPKGVGWDPLTALGGSLLQANTTNTQCSESVPPQANTTAQRLTTSVLGIGLIEAIPDADLLFFEANPPSPNVSGRAHMVQPLETPTGPLRVGRFGWKAQVATVLSFAGDAALNEIGFTNRLLPVENAPNGNTTALALCDPVADPEDGPDAQGLHFIDRVTHFQRYLAAPPQTPRTGMSGEQIFINVGCADCHVPSYTTSNDPALESALRGQVIKPYSDFLVHDMGINADFISQGQVDVQEVRTPALWGVRDRDPLWHDGRVAGGSFEQRILGSGGVIDQHAGFGSESDASATAFRALPLADQQSVVRFLDSLGRREFDINGDNVLDRTDWTAFVSARGGPYTPDDPAAVFDFDQDGDVDSVDYGVFATVYDLDCNLNGSSDLLDIINLVSADVNWNGIPDECEHCQVDLGFAGGGALALSICGDDLSQPGSRASVALTGSQPLAPLFFVVSTSSNPVQLLGTEWIVPSLPAVLFSPAGVADANGEFHLLLAGFGGSATMNWIVQMGGFQANAIDMSNALSVLVSF